MNEPGLPGEATTSRAGIVVGRDSSGINSHGDHATNIQARQVTLLSGLPTAGDVPPAAGQVGVPGAGLFVGRERELTALKCALEQSTGVVVHAVHGLGGIGKTSLVARYVEIHGAQYSQVVWITADTPRALAAGLAGFAIALEPQ